MGMGMGRSVLLLGCSPTTDCSSTRHMLLQASTNICSQVLACLLRRALLCLRWLVRSNA
jgi:hypothetical protein